MSFWNLSDNQSAKTTTGQFETGGGQMEPIPANTTVLAAPDEAKLASYQGDEYISLRWTVLAPAEYKNRKVFQKIQVFDPDSKKADKAKRMLAAIDANAGGAMLKADQPPSDALLTKSLVNKPMHLKLQVWEVEDANSGEKKRGNWVSAVAPRGPAQAPQQAATPSGIESTFEEDIIPF